MLLCGCRGKFQPLFVRLLLVIEPPPAPSLTMPSIVATYQPPGRLLELPQQPHDHLAVVGTAHESPTCAG